jgi:hypothetical protein
VKEYYEVINIVYVSDESVFGTVENLGAFASIVKYNKDGIDYEVLLENEEFAIIDEIVFERVEMDEND